MKIINRILNFLFVLVLLLLIFMVVRFLYGEAIFKFLLIVSFYFWYYLPKVCLFLRDFLYSFFVIFMLLNFISLIKWIASIIWKKVRRINERW